ncbi:hypothetical protein DFH09DRAFT_942314, partial [Mycena vulgaris]
TMAYSFRPVDESTNPPSRFATGIKTPHAIQSILLWAFLHGLGFDSCWRHKNENRAPVTFITTIDQNGRMLPGPVLISANVTAETLEEFLRQVKDLVEQMARDLLDGMRFIGFRKQLMEAAERVRDNDWNWVPLFFMIDKSMAEFIAIRGVWRNIIIRLCQFHVIQAILRWERDQDASGARPKLTRKAKSKLLYAVRELQRCRSAEDWEDDVEMFKSRIATFTNRTTKTAIIAYFEKNWFVDLWRDSWTDIGLPNGHNRDAISTNNWTERAFKTFDQIFLENRANKSIYRLVMIIATEWFAFYENWQVGTQKVDKQAFKVSEWGHRLWNSGAAIIAMPRDAKGRRVWRVANTQARLARFDS